MSECQFNDKPHLTHRPFSERAPICWDCFNAALDADAKWEAIARQLGDALAKLNDDGICDGDEIDAALSVYRDAIKEEPT